MWLVIQSFFHAISKYKLRVGAYLILTLLVLVTTSFQPYLYKEAVDGLIQNSISHTSSMEVLWLISIWFVLTYGQTIFESLRNWLFWDGLSNPTFVEYLESYYQQILQLDYSFFIKKKGGEVMKILDDGIEAYSSLTMVMFEQLLIPILSFFVLLAIAFYQNVTLTIICLIIVPLHALWTFYNYKKTKVYSNNSQKAWHKLFGSIGDTINNILTTKSFQQETHEHTHIKSLSAHAIEQQLRSNRIWFLADFFDINTFATASILITSFFLIGTENITVGTMVMFTNILNRLLVPVQVIKSNIREIQTNIIKYKALQNLLREKPTIANSNAGHSTNSLTGRLILKNISFTYENKKEILKNVSLNIAAGEKVALVGHSGAGKSTLAFLLMRFYDVQKGKILLDNKDIRDWNYDNLRSHFGVVWQENILFHKSIFDNIRYSKPDATEAEVIAAAKQAHAHEFIMRLPKQYKSIVGERGVKLSGGEKQRIAIARALLKDPRIVILDEATSALDSLTEQQVQKGILNLVKDRTAIIIAHRLSTIQHCDKIVVMDQGEIVAVGKHQELLKTCQLYQAMVQLQMNGFLAE